MNRARTAVNIWLLSIIAMVFLMVAVGGITRLTDSGLSIVEWKPLVGAIPPLSHEAWEKAFDQYKQFPEYKAINHSMDLDGFKKIYFWEYFHRLLGRLMGLVFLIPFVIFLIRKTIGKKFAFKTTFAFILGGAQGFLGWYMVKSGLVARPDVSHYRLAAHLLLALVIISYVYWLFLATNQTNHKSKNVSSSAKISSVLLFALIVLQITYGAFVAGLDAGIGYNTFPLMNGEWFPRAFFFLEPLWLNFIENNVSVQFIHRSLGILIFFILNIIGFWWCVYKKDIVPKNIVLPLVIIGWVQFFLGVFTLVLTVPIVLASLHQIGATIFLIATLRYLFFFFAKSIDISQ